MRFQEPLQEAVLLKRHKRFLADIVLINQQKHTIYCPNASNLAGCDTLGSRIWFSRHSNEHKTYQDTWELVEVDGGHLVCVNNKRAQQIILDAVAIDKMPELAGYKHVSTNASFQTESVDFLFSDKIHLEDQNSIDEDLLHDDCFVSVQSVTFGDEIHRGFFPDTQSNKINKQLSTLIAAKEKGYRAVWLYCVMNTGIHRVFPADHIDSEFGCLLRQAVIAGVEMVAYSVDISLEEMHLGDAIEVCVPARMLCTPRAEQKE
tara:strand:- start:9501 stop:10283 length:783 start_codon:yes stop_codon:yes gene_type:complete